MGTYHQMGHDAENLLGVPELASYRGAILSPVNYCQNKVIAQIQKGRAHQAFETIFDPQLYYPKTQRRVLREWPYFPAGL